MQGIYKITNKINGKCYIGQSVDIAKRWREHTGWSFNKKRPEYEYPLYRAIRKYGIESFLFEIIEEVKVSDQLTPRELYWYYLYKPEYNQTLPAESPFVKINNKRKKVVQKINRMTNKVEYEYESVREAARQNGIHHKNILDVCSGKQKSSLGFYWKFKEIN
jgi:group I intron endonuclease